MCPIKLRAKRMFRIFRVLKMKWIMPFCNCHHLEHAFEVLCATDRHYVPSSLSWSSSSSVYFGRRMQLSFLSRSLIQVWSSSLKLYLTGYFFQKLSSLSLKTLTLDAVTTSSGNEFQGFTTLTAKLFLLISNVDGSVASSSEWPLVTVFWKVAVYLH